MKKTIFNIRLILAALAVSATCLSCNKKEERGELKRIWYNGSYNRDFNDLNDVHLAEAKRIGITPASNREEAEKVKDDMHQMQNVIVGVRRIVGVMVREIICIIILKTINLVAVF